MISLCELLTIVIESNLWAELTMNHIYRCSVKFHRQNPVDSVGIQIMSFA